MADPRQTVAFEIFVLRHAQWEMYARFGPEGRDIAVRRAKEANRNPNIQAVKVIQEVFDSFAEISEEHIVYKSGRKKPTEVGYSTAAEDALSLLRDLKQGPKVAAPVERRPPEPVHGLVRITVIAVAIGFAAASAITFLMAYAFRKTDMSMYASTSVGDAALLTVLFFLVFAGVTGFSAYRLASSVARIPVVRSRRRVRRTVTGASAEPERPKPVVRRATKVPTATTQNHEELSPEVKEQSDYLKDYLRMAVRPVRGAFDVNDSFIRFGINLFAAGACEALCQQREITAETTLEIMQICVRALGVDKAQAAGFSANYVEYLISDPRYMEMFSNGRQAIQGHMASQPDANDALVNALHLWATPSETADAQRLVTIIFSRVANYEEMGIEQGESAAQELLHAHNFIVERALLEFGGKKIKQINDGVMGAFMDTVQALHAGIAIRDRVTDHNASNPKLKAHVKIGLNSGEPIAENNDLFGVSVQLATRVMETAEPGQVLVSKNVCDQLSGNPDLFSLQPRGNFDLEGFSDPLPLFAVSSNP